MTIHKTTQIPSNAKVGDVWTDETSFKRVLSRGGAWENVNLGATHPDEVKHDDAEQRPEAEQRQQDPRVGGGAVGTTAVSQGDGNDGQVSGGAVGAGQQESGEVEGEGGGS